MLKSLNLQWGAKPLQYLTPNWGTKHPAINHGNVTLLWWEQIKYKPLATMLSPGSCDFAYILQRYIHFKTPIPLQQFKERFKLQKATGDCPSKLSSVNVWHAICLISSGKAENAVQVTKALTNIVNQPLSISTVHRQLRKTGMKAVVKSKQPLLSAKHCKACLDFAYAHKDWTLEDWKKVVWSDETKINRLGSNGHKWM